MTWRLFRRLARRSVVLSTILLMAVVTGCTTSVDPSTPSSTRGADGGGGGVLYVLTSRDALSSLDPQRVNTPVDQALLGDFVHRTLVRYAQEADLAAQSSVVPDLATDIGTPNDDFTEWSFTIRDDARWADGAPIVCEDVKYGVSRQFARGSLVGGLGLAVELLAIPTGPDGESGYSGPYSGEGEELFDQAVSCEGQQIVFSLSEPVADFPEALTHVEFSPVRADQDTGERYEDQPLSSGPYEVSENTAGSVLVLRRNPAWEPSSDPLRPAHPDEVVVQFSLAPEEIARRVTADAGDDRFAIVGDDAGMGALAGIDVDLPQRSWSQPAQGVTFLSVNTRLLPLLEQRLAILAATDREAAATSLGNAAAEPADGLIAPGLALDHAPTGLADGLLAEPIQPTGDAAVAERLRSASGRDLPELTIDYPELETAAAHVQAVAASLGEAGIAVAPNPMPLTDYYQSVLDPEQRGHLSWMPWQPDWANATRVVPPLFGAGEPFNLSGVNESGGVQDAELAAAIEAAQTEPDRRRQAELMQTANSRAMELGLAVPLAYSQTQRAWGSGLTNVFYHAPIESYAFAQIVPGTS